MKKIMFVVLVLTIIAAPCFAQEISTLSVELQEALDRSREQLGIVGVSAAVITPDEGLWLGVSGLSEKTPPNNIQPQMLFNIGHGLSL